MVALVSFQTDFELTITGGVWSKYTFWDQMKIQHGQIKYIAFLDFNSNTIFQLKYTAIFDFNTIQIHHHF